MKLKKKKITLTDYNKRMDKILSNKRKHLYQLLIEALDFAGSVEIVDEGGDYEKRRKVDWCGKPKDK